MSDERHSRGTKARPERLCSLPAWEIPAVNMRRNRHNVGFIVADALHEHYKFGPWKAQFEGLLSEGMLGGRKAYLLKPQTYMNLSGGSVGPALRFFKLPLDALVVIHDEIDLAAGKLKVKDRRRRCGAERLALHHRDAGAGLSPGAAGHRPSRREEPWSSAMCWRISARTTFVWLKPLVDAMVEAAPLLAKDDDAGFMSKVALLLKPPKPIKKKDE